MKTTAVVMLASLFACSSKTSPTAQNQSAQDPAARPASRPMTPPPSTFARFVPTTEDADEGRFETAITTYARPDGTRVSLIAAIHIADAEHFAELQTEFEGYEALLYELVADPDTRPQPGERRARGVIGTLQFMLKKGLELEFQLDAIDYTPDNFVHADLTPDGFEEQLDARGESVISMVFDLMAREQKAMRDRREEEIDDPSKQPEKFDIVSAFRRGESEGRHQLRMLVAKQLAQIEMLAAGGGEDDDGSVLLEGRNDRALEVLDEQIQAGRRRLAIYYGAAHLPDMEAKLLKRGFEKVDERWLQAWDVTRREPATTSRQSK